MDPETLMFILVIINSFLAGLIIGTLTYKLVDRKSILILALMLLILFGLLMSPSLTNLILLFIFLMILLIGIALYSIFELPASAVIIFIISAILVFAILYSIINYPSIYASSNYLLPIIIQSPLY
jgi:signal transduction histidine kinase